MLVTDSLLDWWESRFSKDDLVEIAEALWGRRESWGPRETWSLVPGVNVKDGLRDLET